MSELKAIRSGEIYNIIEYEDCYRTDDLYYPKSEADKVIAGLKEHVKSLILDNYLKDKEIRHHKYKRCFAMAKACDKYAFALELQGQGRSTELLKRHNRAIERKYKWLAIAEKFKEAK